MGDTRFRVELRLDEPTKGRWQVGATDRGYTLSEFVRACVDAELDRPDAPFVPPSPAEQLAEEIAPTLEDAKPKARRARTQMCEHRIPPTAHCAKCDA